MLSGQDFENAYISTHGFLARSLIWGSHLVDIYLTLLEVAHTALHCSDIVGTQFLHQNSPFPSE